MRFILEVGGEDVPEASWTGSPHGSESAGHSLDNQPRANQQLVNQADYPRGSWSPKLGSQQRHIGWMHIGWMHIGWMHIGWISKGLQSSGGTAVKRIAVKMIAVKRIAVKRIAVKRGSMLCGL